MMVTFVSQCEKKALKKTRRVLDAFANRIGDNTWQTVITEDGLITVKKMLRQTASKSTAVSCHWIRSRARSQFLWVVGNKHKFNAEGIVAVNTTSLNLEHREQENGWELNEVIMLASSISGLFHDFGKANDLFQRKLKGDSQAKSEPYRHEWVSLRLFEAFAKDLDDTEWLTQLSNIRQPGQAEQIEKRVKNTLVKDEKNSPSPFRSFASHAHFARLIAWLIVSHHRLPYPHQGKVNLTEAGSWLKMSFGSHWNSNNAANLNDIPSQLLSQNWTFSSGTPFISRAWQKKAEKFSLRALSYYPHIEKTEWLNQRFICHMSRLSLMLADHYYSSLTPQESNTKWQDEKYMASANTDRKTHALKQKLDEHNIGVAQNAFLFTKHLPMLKSTLPEISGNKAFSKNSTMGKYSWQNDAFKTAKQFSKVSEQHGFFGINMASTGCGKTLANARIMYALADEREGCRFSVALGLRTLTLQTGDAYRELLKLHSDELAVLIGSSAVKLVHQLDKDENVSSHGSESSDSLFDELHISYAGQIYDGRLRHWLSNSPKLEQLISAPVLVSTIDHLIPATESKRGGKQIAPMLRLLTSDLVLDEPDDFGLEDLPALCRLVNWAGMLGSRVLLSSATLPPTLIDALYSAYVEGRKHFNRAHFPHKKIQGVVCAWFDENKSIAEIIADKDTFESKSKKFVQSRLKILTDKKDILRKGEIVSVLAKNNSKQKDYTTDKNLAYKEIADIVYQQIHQMHDRHKVTNGSGKSISLGVVRFANINPMVEVAKILLSLSPKAKYQFHFCVYHSQFPLALRSFKEFRLDKILTRYDENALWELPEINNAIKGSEDKNHVFIVLGTSVVEVGRDHDYDWAIAEPSSLRSIIQLAGRVQRHRQRPTKSANVAILDKNIRAIRGEPVAYCKPGFESSKLPLGSTSLSDLIANELDAISAIPRMIEPLMKEKYFHVDTNKTQAKPVCSFAVQEHRALRVALKVVGGEPPASKFYNSEKPASFWWDDKLALGWNAEFIKQTEFRQSQPKETFVLRIPQDEAPVWSQVDDTRYPFTYIKQKNRFANEAPCLAKGNSWWFNESVEDIYQSFSNRLNLSIERTSEKLGEISLREQKEDEQLHWHWHEQLGVFENK